MGSGGSQTLWSPSNEAGAYKGVLIDAVHGILISLYVKLLIWAGLTTDHVLTACFPGLSLMVGLYGSLWEPFKRE